MKIATVIVRLLLGIMFVVFGSNAFFHFLKMPPPHGLGGQFTMAMFLSGYFYPVAILQVAGGLLLLIGRFVPLGLMLLGPVVVNILLFHTFLDQTGLPLACVVSFLSLFLLFAYRDRFAPLLKP